MWQLDCVKVLDLNGGMNTTYRLKYTPTEFQLYLLHNQSIKNYFTIYESLINLETGLMKSWMKSNDK